MSVTRLRINSKFDYFLDNDTFEGHWGIRPSYEPYDYSSYYANKSFYLGNAECRVRVELDSKTYLTYLDISGANYGTTILLKNTEITDKIKFHGEYLFFRPLNSVLKQPKKCYNILVASEFSFEGSISSYNGERVFDKPFSILIFNKDNDFIGASTNCSIDNPICLSFCDDAKFSTLCKFENIIEVCKALVRIDTK